MHITISQESLYAGLKAVGRALPVRSVIPSLSGICLEVQGNELCLRATDMELTVQKTVQVSAARNGALVLPGRTLTELVRRIPPAQITITAPQGQNSACIRWNDSDCVVQGFGCEQFPAMPPGGPGPAVSMAADQLMRLLRETGFATGHDEARPWFTGVCLTISGPLATAMATDTAVVAYSEAQVENPGGVACTVIIPGRSLLELERLLAETGAASCQFTLSHNQLQFHLGNVTLVTRLLEGQYPDFRRLLPTQFAALVRLDRRQLLDALERTSLLATHGAVQLSAEGGHLTLSARSPELGQLTDRLAAHIHGSPFTLPLNGRFLIEGLKSMTSPEVLLEFHSPRTAVRVRSSTGAAAFFAVLPLLQF